MIIVDLIKELMYQQNKTITDVVKATGLSYLTVENIVLRDVIPIPEDAQVILNYLGISLEEVLSLY
jgi:transcriptional regulator with XRE-family HTH domain